MKHRAILIVVSVLVIIGMTLGLAACAKPKATGETQNMKIGMIVALNFPHGLYFQKAMEIESSNVNAAGGLEIGGQRYLLEPIVYDTKTDQALAKSSAERAVYQDQVYALVGDLWVKPALPIADANKKIFIAGPPDITMFDTKYKYLFNGGTGHSTFAAFTQWIAKQYPDLKTYLNVSPDRDDGHELAEMNERMAKTANLTVLPSEFFPPNATDLSALGTKIKTLNPDILEPYGGGPMVDSEVMKAAYAAGYRGQLISGATIPGEFILGIAGAAPAEGFVSIGWPQEFDLAPNPLAPKFKADYIAKFGKWDSPETVVISCWWILKDAMMKANSTDVDKVADVIASGLKWQSPNGNGQMVSRPDLGQKRTVMACTGDIPIKQIKDGKIIQIGEFKLSDVLDFVNRTFGSK